MFFRAKRQGCGEEAEMREMIWLSVKTPLSQECEAHPADRLVNMHVLPVPQHCCLMTGAVFEGLRVEGH